MSRHVLPVLLSVAVLSATGCASLRSMQHPIPEAYTTACERLIVAPTQYLLVVNVARQEVSLYEQGRYVKTFRCSTSRFGVGQQEGSNRTPLGLHRIAEKIGDGEAPGTVFKSRKVVGHVSDIGITSARITTRILWLEGCDPGFNQGGNVDSHDRYIYIHGTGDQESIGQPDSHGCIHLADDDLIGLFNLLPTGTLVWISEN
jgi:hypothetical protein